MIDNMEIMEHMAYRYRNYISLLKDAQRVCDRRGNISIKELLKNFFLSECSAEELDGENPEELAEKLSQWLEVLELVKENIDDYADIDFSKPLILDMKPSFPDDSFRELFRAEEIQYMKDCRIRWILMDKFYNWKKRNGYF